MPWSECRCHRVECAVSEAPSHSSVGQMYYLETRITLEHHLPLPRYTSSQTSSETM